MGPGVGQLQGILTDALAHHDDVDVEGAGSVDHATRAAEVVLDGERPVQQRQRLQRGLCHHDEVQEVLLVGSAHGLGLVDG